MNIEEETISFFNSKGKLIGGSKQEIRNCEYLDTGVLDSMEFIEMIVFLEDKFKIRFSSEHLQSEQFRKIGGLIDLVKELHMKKSNLENV